MFLKKCPYEFFRMLKGTDKNVEIRNIIKEIQRFEQKYSAACRVSECKFSTQKMCKLQLFFGTTILSQHAQIVISVLMNPSTA